MADRNRQQSVDPTSGAIDLLYFPPSQRPSAQGSETRCHEPVEVAVALKDDVGLGYVFVTQCKRWSCDRRIYCEDTHLDDILRYTSPYPQHFIGIGAYNPLDIGSSTHEAESGIKYHGFRGVYIHPDSYGITLNDRRMYPLYVKATEWRVPVILDLRSAGSEGQPARASDMEQVANDFPDLNLVVALPPWPANVLLKLTHNFANIFFCFDTAALLAPETRQFVNSQSAQGRCMWGSNGLPWKEAVSEIERLKLTNAARLVRDNALELFGLAHLRKRKAKPFHETEAAQARIVAE